mgnify:CR=1 FL=1
MHILETCAHARNEKQMIYSDVPGEEVFNELLSYFGESQVQGHHLEPGGRGGDGLHAGTILHESVLSFESCPRSRDSERDLTNFF